MVAATQANLLTSVQEFIADFPVTKQDARDKYTVPHSFKTSHAHQQMYAAAHDNVRSQRVRLGLPHIGAARGEDVFKSYQDMTGFSALVLGIAQGLMYNSAAGPNACFNAIESGLITSSNFFFIASKLYLPYYLPEFQLVLQDNVALIGGLYTDCDVNKFFDSMTTLISSEGVSSLGARAGGSYFFQYAKF
jgi:hypothetical protein